MGCFLACFGFKKKNKHPKRRKPRIVSSSDEQSHLRYVPLDSDVSGKLDTIENLISSDSKPKEKPREASRLKTKKKVSFNLNVKAYEPIHYEDEISSYLSEGDEETKWELNTEAISSSFRSFPANYRYQNFEESYDDSEDQELDWEKELDFDDIVEDDDEDVENNEDDYSYGSDEEVQDIDERSQELLLVSQNKSDQRVSSVLKPVENLSQWKAIKAKPAQPKQDKENIVLEQRETNTLSNAKISASFAYRNTRKSNAVDASLSNWLDSMETKRMIVGSH